MTCSLSCTGSLKSVGLGNHSNSVRTLLSVLRLAPLRSRGLSSSSVRNSDVSFSQSGRPSKPSRDSVVAKVFESGTEFCSHSLAPAILWKRDLTKKVRAALSLICSRSSGFCSPLQAFMTDSKAVSRVLDAIESEIALDTLAASRNAEKITRQELVFRLS